MILGQTRKVCPGCKSDGPHDVYRYFGQPEMVCSACGMQHHEPFPYTDGNLVVLDEGRGGRNVRARKPTDD